MQIEGILISLVWCTALLFVLLRQFGGYPRALTSSLFVIKIAAAFALQAIFTYYYTDRSTADIYRFFDDGILLRDILFQQPAHYVRIMLGWDIDSSLFREQYFEHMNAWIKPYDSGLYNDNHFLIRLNALFALVSFGFYEVHSVLFTSMSFVGILWLCDAILVEQRDRNWALAFAILLPSSLLWLSGGLKEAVLMFGLGAVFKVIHLKTSDWRRAIPLAAIAILVLLNLKLYVIAFLIPALVAAFIQRRGRISIPLASLLWLTTGIVGVAALHFSGLRLDEYIVRKQHEFINVVNELQSGSAFFMSRLDESYWAIISALPEAFANVLLRPYPTEMSSPQEVLMFLENLLIWALVALSLLRWNHVPGNVRRNLWWVSLFILPILLLTGLVTPVFGAIMRYRAPSVVILIIALTPNIRALLARRLNIDSP